MFHVWLSLACSYYSKGKRLQSQQITLLAQSLAFSLSACGLQHGANALFVLGELLLNTIPFQPHLMGYVGFWTSLYGIWGALRPLLLFHCCYTKMLMESLLARCLKQLCRQLCVADSRLPGCVQVYIGTSRLPCLLHYIYYGRLLPYHALTVL